MACDMVCDMKAASISKSAATDSESKSIRRQISGVSVRFYKRTPKANYTMDFEVMGERIQESTQWPSMADAERRAAQRVREVKDLKLSLGTDSQVKGGFATVGEVLQRLSGGDKVCSDGAMRTYKSALLRLARTADEQQPERVTLDAALSRANVELMFQRVQGRASGVNWVDKLPVNGGLNSTMRNVSALLNTRMRDLKLKGLKLPDSKVLKEVPKLKAVKAGFKPWSEEMYQAMNEASEELRVSDPELWLVNAMLRRLGLRNEELLSSARHWIEVQGDRAWLVICDRDGEFQILKGGRPRKLELDAELQAALLPRGAGYLIAPDLTSDQRYGLIYRTHSKWMRQWVGEDAAKTNHQLRMYAASKLYMRDGLEAAAYFLGDTVATTETYYTTWLGKSAMLDGAAVAAVHG